MKIKTIKVGIPQQDCEDLFIRVPYEIGATSCNSYWEVRNKDGQSLLNGNVLIDESTLAKWGTDDKVIEDLILTKLKLVRA